MPSLPTKKLKDTSAYDNLVDLTSRLQAFYYAACLLNLASGFYLKQFAKKMTILFNVTFLSFSLELPTNTTAQLTDAQYLTMMLLGANIMCFFFGPGGTSASKTTDCVCGPNCGCPPGECDCPKAKSDCVCGPNCGCPTGECECPKEKPCPCSGAAKCSCGASCACGATKTTPKCPCNGTDTCTCGASCKCGAPKSTGKCPCNGTDVCTCGESCKCGAPKAAAGKKKSCDCVCGDECGCPEGKCNCKKA